MKPITDNATINLKDIEFQSIATDTARHLIDMGYSVSLKKNLSTDKFEINANKEYIVNHDPAETKLFKKLVESFDKAIDFLQKEDGVLISIDHSVGAIDIHVVKKRKGE